MTKPAVAVVSGGMDSVTLAHLLHSQGYALHLLSFDYGQRHRKELEFAADCAERLHAKHDIVDLSDLTRLLKGSALTDDIDVPEGHYADPSMKLTVVPNRNAIMFSIAWGVAVAEQAVIVASGIHAGDHPIYPDCRPMFAQSFNEMAQIATQGFAHPDLVLFTPFLHRSKTDIARLGSHLGVPFERTWSCYKGGTYHCGKCGTCVERIEALQKAGVTDLTVYEEQAHVHHL